MRADLGGGQAEGATRPEPAVSRAGCRCGCFRSGPAPSQLRCDSSWNGGPDRSLSVGREEVGLGRGTGRSPVHAWGVGGASTREGWGPGPETGARSRPLRFLQSGCIEPGAPSPREQSPRPSSSSLLRVLGGMNKSLTPHPFPAPSPSGPPFLPFLYCILIESDQDGWLLSPGAVGLPTRQPQGPAWSQN